LRPANNSFYRQEPARANIWLIARASRWRALDGSSIAPAPGPVADVLVRAEPRPARLEAQQAEEPAVVGFSFVVEAQPHPLAGRISLASTLDRESGVTHFVAHAIVREVTAP